MAAVTHLTPVVQTTLQTEVATSYTTVSGTTLANGNFTAGQKYLLILNARVAGDQSNSLFSFRWVHGSTVFTDGEHIQEPSTVAAGRFFPFTYVTVWTAVAAEDVFFQMKAPAGQKASADSISLFAIRLDAELVENTDWFFAESTADEVVENFSSRNIGSTITINANGSDKWLVFGNISVDVSLTGSSLGLFLSSEAGTSAPASNGAPSMLYEGESVSEFRVNALFRVFTPSVGQTTYGMRARLSSSPRGSSNIYTIQSVRMFALNLALFADVESVWTAAATIIAEDPSTTTTATATALTATADSDFLILGYAYGTTGLNVQTNRPHRMYIEDDLDGILPTGDGTAGTFHNDAYDLGEHMPLFTIAGPTFQNADGDHTVSLKGSASGDTDMTQVHRSLAVISMELAGTAPAIVLTPDPIVVPVGLPSVSLSVGTKTLTPDPIVVAVALPPPTMGIGALTLTPDPIVVPVALPDPTVALGALTLTPDPIVVPVALPNILVDSGAAPITITPDPIVVSISLPGISLGFGTKTLTPDPIVVPIALPVPNISIGLILTPDPIVVPIVLPSMQVNIGLLTLTPDPIVVTIGLPDVVVEAGSNYIFSGSDIAPIDVSAFRSGVLFKYAAVLQAGAAGQSGRSRLFNITDGVAVSGSEVTYSDVVGTDKTLYISGTFGLSGNKQYRPQHKADNPGEKCIWHSSKYAVVYT